MFLFSALMTSVPRMLCDGTLGLVREVIAFLITAVE